MSKIEARLAEMGIELPRPPKPVANYLCGVEVGDIAYISGTVGTKVGEDGEDYNPYPGQAGEISVEDAYQSARLTAINHLSMIKHVIGDLDRLVRVVKMIGYINAKPGFKDAPQILNGASDFWVELLGEEKGTHARAALYQDQLTIDAPIEIEMTVQVTPREG
ncbi:RidA family protein [Hoeflea poritis]|uniref:RidA family protein n=1 Tax=Hoeflea poritis TaxID=2993659 RepID=A0ABT4VSX3_9HYPH|nr:RidA family protein [Hoeflea poritis]MDA4847817.1 RidA family protein [Hoeflea poritis]